MQQAQAQPNELAELVEPVWSAAWASQALEVTPEELQGRQRAGLLLAVALIDGDEVYPVFQFQNHGGQTQVKPGLQPLLRALREYDPWAVAVLLKTPSPELQGMTPLEWLSTGGDPEAVALLGEAVAREWSAGG